jgi:hypothetical protein
MSSKNLWSALVVVLLIAAHCALHAQEGGTKKARKAATPPSQADSEPASGAPALSIKKGDPPPGNAMALSVPQARAVLRDAIARRYVGTVSACGGALGLKACVAHTLSPATDVRVRSADFSFASPHNYQWTGFVMSSMKTPQYDAGKVSITFNKADYLQVYRLEKDKTAAATHSSYSPRGLYVVGFLPTPEGAAFGGPTVLSWLDESVARSFADAFNRLVYAAYHQEDSATFSAAAKAWRENPAKPPLSPEVEQHKVLADKALDAQNLDSAIEHYETALEIQPMWPDGWFSLATFHAAQNNYAGAARCMRHYLELAPDAPDAKDAREQMAAWEAKAKG